MYSAPNAAKSQGWTSVPSGQLMLAEMPTLFLQMPVRAYMVKSVSKAEVGAMDTAAVAGAMLRATDASAALTWARKIGERKSVVGSRGPKTFGTLASQRSVLARLASAVADAAGKLTVAKVAGGTVAVLLSVACKVASWPTER